MNITGACYCGEVRYQVSGEPTLRLICYCRECQYITGGSPNVVLGMPSANFHYTHGQPKDYSRPDLAAPVTRQFCGSCGTHLITVSPRLPDSVLVKVGTMDDPKLFHKPLMGIFAADKQLFHELPDQIPIFEGRPESLKRS